jgi:TRAP-type C4-dicarboxylate transport system permease small subunit
MGTVLRFFDRRLVEWFVFATYAYFCLIILFEVVQRHLFGTSSPWGEMTARYAFVYLTYVAAAEAIRHGRHIRIEVLATRLPRWALWLRDLYIDLLIVLLAGAVIYYSLQVIDIQLMAGIVMPSADVNMAFAQAALPLGWGLIVIRILQNWWDRWAGVEHASELPRAD